MMQQLEYKGYVGVVNYCDEDKIFYGSVENLPKTMISYHGVDMESLMKDFMEAVDFHLIPDDVLSTEPNLAYGFAN